VCYSMKQYLAHLVGDGLLNKYLSKKKVKKVESRPFRGSKRNDHEMPILGDGRPWSRKGRKSMENVEEKMKCSGIWRIRERLLLEMENLVKMKSRSGAMVWKVARGDEGEG